MPSSSSSSSSFSSSAEPQLRGSRGSVPRRTSAARRCSPPDLNRELRRAVFPAGPQSQTRSHKHKHTSTVTNTESQTHNHKHTNAQPQIIKTKARVGSGRFRPISFFCSWALCVKKCFKKIECAKKCFNQILNAKICKI